MPTSVQPLQAQISTQQPILSTGIQPSPLQQQLQQNQQQQQQQPVHSTLLQQLKNPPQMGVPPQQPLLPGQLPPGNQKERVTIWNGTLEWHEKQKGKNRLKLRVHVDVQSCDNIFVQTLQDHQTVKRFPVKFPAKLQLM